MAAAAPAGLRTRASASKKPTGMAAAAQDEPKDDVRAGAGDAHGHTRQQGEPTIVNGMDDEGDGCTAPHGCQHKHNARMSTRLRGRPGRQPGRLCCCLDALPPPPPCCPKTWTERKVLQQHPEPAAADLPASTPWAATCQALHSYQAAWCRLFRQAVQCTAADTCP